MKKKKTIRKKPFHVEISISSRFNRQIGKKTVIYTVRCWNYCCECQWCLHHGISLSRSLRQSTTQNFYIIAGIDQDRKRAEGRPFLFRFLQPTYMSRIVNFRNRKRKGWREVTVVLIIAPTWKFGIGGTTGGQSGLLEVFATLFDLLHFLYFATAKFNRLWEMLHEILK